MKPIMISDNGIYATFLLKNFDLNIKFLVDSEDVWIVKNKDFIVRRESYRHINPLLTNRLISKETRQSLATMILKIDKSRRVYMKDNFLNRNQDFLDYRKSNLTLEHEKMNNYGDIIRKHVKHRDDILYNNKITEEEVIEIRDKYRNQGFLLKDLADEYEMSITAISDIVTYRTWTDKNNPNLRVFNLNNIKIIEKSHNKPNKFTYNDIIDKTITFKFMEEKLYFYIEKLPIDKLIYLEVRDIENNFICSVDLYFPNKLGPRAKENFIIGNFYPRKIGKDLIKEYIEKLKYII